MRPYGRTQWWPAVMLAPASLGVCHCDRFARLFTPAPAPGTTPGDPAGGHPATGPRRAVAVRVVRDAMECSSAHPYVTGYDVRATPARREVHAVVVSPVARFDTPAFTGAMDAAAIYLAEAPRGSPVVGPSCRREVTLVISGVPAGRYALVVARAAGDGGTSAVLAQTAVVVAP